MGRAAVQLGVLIGIQQEVIPRVSVSAAFFHRALGNFWVTDNELVSASDYTFYSATVPTDPRLPNSGQVISGIPDLNPDKLGLSRNVVKDDSQFGDHIEHFDGFDVTANGRFSDLFLQGGISSGRRLTDVCAVGPLRCRNRRSSRSPGKRRRSSFRSAA